MSFQRCTVDRRACGPREAGRRGQPRVRAGARLRSGSLYCALLLAALGCGKERRTTVDVSIADAGRAATDGGSKPAHSPRPDGDPILPPTDARVVLPFRGKAVRYAIDVAADPGVLDVQLSMDTTGSMGPEIHELQRDLERKLVPELRSRVPSVNFGVSKFADFPLAPFGAAGPGGQADKPFVLLTPITSDVSRVASAVAALDQPLGNGGDLPEAGAEALWQIATGEGYTAHGTRLIEAFERDDTLDGGEAGGVGFRDGALRVVLHITDAPSHLPSDYGADFPDTHDIEQAGEALHDINARLVAIVAGTCDAASSVDCDEKQHDTTRAELERVAIATGALGPDPHSGKCPNGIDGELIPSRDDTCPLVFDVDAHGGGLTDTLIDAIADLVDGIRFEAVTGAASDDPIGFVAGVVPLPDSGRDAPEIDDLLPAGKPDGEADSFVHVRARTKLRFAVELRNRAIAPTDVDQLFRVVVQIKGDGLILSQATLRVVVPKGDSLAPADDETDDDADGGT